MDINGVKRLSIIGGVAAVVAMGAVTATLANEGTQSLSTSFNAPATFVRASTQGPAPTELAVPSAVPKHVSSWKCYDIFTSQC
ncbi:MAG: hypothetical protein QOH57_2423 [Mycobacterium sp.]|jgi:hypothetical protein|nr:hypothetical protein [Mycobacterium sp.]